MAWSRPGDRIDGGDIADRARVADEDACRLRTLAAPFNLSSIRSAAISWFRSQGYEDIAAAIRASDWNPSRLLAKLGILKQ